MQGNLNHLTSMEGFRGPLSTLQIPPCEDEGLLQGFDQAQAIQRYSPAEIDGMLIEAGRLLAQHKALYPQNSPGGCAEGESGCLMEEGSNRRDAVERFSAIFFILRFFQDESVDDIALHELYDACFQSGHIQVTDLICSSDWVLVSRHLVVEEDFSTLTLSVGGWKRLATELYLPVKVEKYNRTIEGETLRGFDAFAQLILDVCKNNRSISLGDERLIPIDCEASEGSNSEEIEADIAIIQETYETYLSVYTSQIQGVVTAPQLKDMHYKVQRLVAGRFILSYFILDGLKQKHPKECLSWDKCKESVNRFTMQVLNKWKNFSFLHAQNFVDTAGLYSDPAAASTSSTAEAAAEETAAFIEKKAKKLIAAAKPSFFPETGVSRSTKKSGSGSSANNIDAVVSQQLKPAW